MSAQSLIFKTKAGFRILYQFHGVWFPFVLLHRVWLYCFRRFFGARSFVFSGQTHRYYLHHYSLDNERIVEVALARDFLHGKHGKTLEVGNVLSHYFSFPHNIVDKYEHAPGVTNEDIVTFSPQEKYDFIVTLSTLEHVGWDEQPRKPEKIEIAINRLKEMLKDGGKMLVTMPLGYNSHVDRLLNDRRTGFSEVRYMLRISSDNQWREASWDEVSRVKYGAPFRCANAIMVGFWSRSS